MLKTDAIEISLKSRNVTPDTQGVSSRVPEPSGGHSSAIYRNWNTSG